MEDEMRFEIRRKIFHAAAGALASIAIYAGAITWQHLLALLALGIIISLISTRARVPVVGWLLGNFERKNAPFPGKGAVFMAAGALFASLLFDKSTAAAAVMIMAIGDSASHIAGKVFGKRRHPFNRYKLVEGSIAGFIAAAIAASFFVPWQHSVAASAAAMALEGFELKLGKTIIDDNLTLPLIAGAAIYALQHFRT